MEPSIMRNTKGSKGISSHFHSRKQVRNTWLLTMPMTAMAKVTCTRRVTGPDSNQAGRLSTNMYPVQATTWVAQ